MPVTPVPFPEHSASQRSSSSRREGLPRKVSLFLAREMILPGSSYWNLAYGRNPGEVKKDEEGMKTMRDLGTNVAWLLKKLAV